MLKFIGLQNINLRSNEPTLHAPLGTGTPDSTVINAKRHGRCWGAVVSYAPIITTLQWCYFVRGCVWVYLLPGNTRHTMRPALSLAGHQSRHQYSFDSTRRSIECWPSTPTAPLPPARVTGLPAVLPACWQLSDFHWLQSGSLCLAVRTVNSHSCSGRSSQALWQNNKRNTCTVTSLRTDPS